MSNIKKINGYDIIDSKMYKATATINSLVLGDQNDAEVILPTGWTADNTFIIGGYYKVYDSDNLVIMRHIYSNTTDGTTGNITTSNEVTYFGNQIYATFDNKISDWVGYKVEFTILLYNKD